MPGIVAGIDGSVHSRRALEWAIGEAVIRRAPLTVLIVAQGAGGFWGPAGYPQGLDLIEHALKTAREEADSALEALGARSRPPSVDIRAVAGLPADEILKSARAQGAEMIVVGSRGAGGFKKLLLGSVSVQVTHHAHCPVVVIPAERA
jgi:nucleotide-binding universal stress UspA family protein